MPNNEKLKEENQSLKDQLVKLQQYHSKKILEFHTHMLAMLMANGGIMVIPVETLNTLDYSIRIITRRSQVNGNLIIETVRKQETNGGGKPQTNVNSGPVADNINDKKPEHS